MKNLNLNITKALMAGAACCFALGMTSCDDENDSKWKIADGSPEVHYVRLPDPATSDSLIVSAYMDNTICIVGQNLHSIKEIWFNDQKAILNTSFITDKTLFVNIPKNIPEKVTHKMYMVTKTDTIDYDFKVLVPGPVVSSISCEYAHDGDIVTLFGDYFIDDENEPLTISMAGNIPVTEIISVEKTQTKFRVPHESQKGYITVSSIYSQNRSKFQFRDDRGMILDWDNTNADGGWRAGKISNSDPEGISGNYVCFKGALSGEAGSSWSEDEFSFNLWGTANGRPEGDLFDTDLNNAILKFEVYVVEAWSANALQMIFTPWSLTGTNSYIADSNFPRGLWRPWESTGSYTTDGWITVSIPIKEFKYTHEGGSSEMAPAGNYGGLTFFVYHGGINGTDCNPHICIDNIRVVPAE